VNASSAAARTGKSVDERVFIVESSWLGRRAILARPSVHERPTRRFQGRDYRLTDVHGKVVTQILA
jgi:hypothetical protein